MSTRSDSGITLRLRRIGTAFVEALQLRHELLSMELRDERGRLVGLIFQGVLGALLLFMAFLCLNLVALLHWWDHRVVVALGLGAFYLLFGVVLLLALRHRLSHAPPPFAGSVEELRKDVVALSGRAEMRRRDYEKQLLRNRIESQRQVAALELRTATEGLSRLNRVTRLAKELMPVLRPVTRAVSGLGPNTRRVLLVAIAAAAIAPLVRSFLRR